MALFHSDSLSFTARKRRRVTDVTPLPVVLPITNSQTDALPVLEFSHQQHNQILSLVSGRYCVLRDDALHCLHTQIDKILNAQPLHRCLCGVVHLDIVSARSCLLNHARVIANDRLDAACHAVTSGACGVWLSHGKVCPACGSASGGWLCSGADSHVHSCDELVADPRLNTRKLVRNRICFHPTDDLHYNELEVVCEHIRHHANETESLFDAANRILPKTQRFPTKQPVSWPSIADKLLPDAMIRRVKAFRRIRDHVSPSDVLQSIGEQGGVRISCAAGRHTADRIQNLQTSSLHAIPHGSFWRTKDREAILVVSQWNARIGGSCVGAVVFKGYVSCPAHEATSDCMCWRPNLTSFRTFFTTDEIFHHKNRIELAPRLHSDKDLERSARRACYGEIHGCRMSCGNGSSITEPSKDLLAKCVSALINGGLPVGIQEARVLKILLPVRLMWFCNSNGDYLCPSMIKCAQCKSECRIISFVEWKTLGVSLQGLFRAIVPHVSCVQCRTFRNISSLCVEFAQILPSGFKPMWRVDRICRHIYSPNNANNSSILRSSAVLPPPINPWALSTKPLPTLAPPSAPNGPPITKPVAAPPSMPKASIALLPGPSEPAAMSAASKATMPTPKPGTARNAFLTIGFVPAKRIALGPNTSPI